MIERGLTVLVFHTWGLMYHNIIYSIGNRMIIFCHVEIIIDQMSSYYPLIEIDYQVILYDHIATVKTLSQNSPLHTSPAPTSYSHHQPQNLPTIQNKINNNHLFSFFPQTVSVYVIIIIIIIIHQKTNKRINHPFLRSRLLCSVPLSVSYTHLTLPTKRIV